jgi:hypothetical protein
MTKIVRASLGLPTLWAGPQFQNSKPVLVIGYWNLGFVCYLVLGVWDFTSSAYSTTPTLQYSKGQPDLVKTSLNSHTFWSERLEFNREILNEPHWFLAQ